MRLAAVVLATGQDTGMKSATPKGLHPLAGAPLVHYAVTATAAAADVTPVLVIGPEGEAVRAAIGAAARSVVQAQRSGAGHAVWQARDLLAGQADTVLVVCADLPLLTAPSLARLAESHACSGAALTALTEDDCMPEQLVIRAPNIGVWCFDAAWLWANLPALLGREEADFLPALVTLAVAQGRTVNIVRPIAGEELLRISTRADLAEAERVLRARINRQWMEAGVTLMDPQATYIDADVIIGQDTVVLPNTYLLGRTVIGARCRIGPGAMVEDCTIGDHCTVLLSVLEQAVMEDESNIGPFGHLRKGARLCRGAHMGNFGEMKNSTLGPGSKMGHFSYLGDAQVAANVNIGAGTITCNFDGVRKHPTVIEEDAFIGSDSMLVAPLHIGRGAKTGAGSVVTHDVPSGAVVYGVPARVRRPADETNSEAAKE